MKNDAAGNDLIANNDVFADILNGNRIFGDYRILPEDLADIPVESTFKDLDGGMRKLGRDIFKEVSKLGIHIMMIGFENQTDINNVMPIRDMGYAYTAYMRQIRQMIVDNKLQGNSAYTKVLHDDQKLKPVLTFVLYFGAKEWKKPLSLMDMLDIPENQKEMIGKYIPDYQIYVIPMRNQPEEVRKRYQSDFAVIADALAYQGKGTEEIKKYLKNDTRVLYHVEQTLNMLRVVSGSKVAKQMYDHYINDKSEREEGEMTMADVFEDIFEDFYEDIEKKNADIAKKNADIEKKNADIEKKNADIEKKCEDIEKKQAELDQQEAEVNQKKAEVDQQEAEVNQKKAEVDQQKAEVDHKEQKLTEQKFKIINNLIAVWDIPTISENMGCSVEEIMEIVGGGNCTI